MVDACAPDRVVFSVGERAYTWRDVVAYAEIAGAWEEIAEQAAARVAASRGADIDADAVDAAAAAFRRERGLLAADELDAWLERRGVRVEDWLAYVRRSLVDTQSVVAHPASPEEVWAEAMCSGRLDDVAEALASRLAVSPETGLADLEAALDAFAARATADDAVDRELASARVEWIRVRYASSMFEDPTAAAEAALAVRADGVRLRDVAALAGVSVELVEAWIEDEEPAVASLLVGAREGELVGPVPVEDGLLVVEILEKLPVDPADPAVRARAAAAMVERAVRREADERIVWHEPL